MKKAVIFDLDGTMWDSCLQVVPAWNRLLKQYGRQITPQDMYGYMGKTTDGIAAAMLPDFDEPLRVEIVERCCREELTDLRENGGQLFPDVIKTLHKLKHDYHLYIVSNCMDGYVQTFLDYYDLNPLFDDIEMFGRTGQPKGENIKTIIHRNNIDRAVYVGDTQGDYESASYADIPFIHAGYGFGTISDDVPVIKSFGELPEAIKKTI